MSFAPFLHKVAGVADPLSRVDGGKLDVGYDLFKPKTPPAPPQVPNPNDAANAAQSLTDSMRMRRGLLANIYAGGQTGAASAPVTGKTQLGA
jgi:hypothetical protein